MESIIPIIQYNQDSTLEIEVMSITRLAQSLEKQDDHQPFEDHKIHFYLILIVTKGSCEHSVDFNTYTLREGSILFVAKNQLHHFDRSILQVNGTAIVISNLFLDQHYLLMDNFRLNRLFNYHIDTPLIKEAHSELLDVAQTLQVEYDQSDRFAKTEILASYLRIFLLKAERTKEYEAIITIKPQWLDTFNQYKIMQR